MAQPPEYTPSYDFSDYQASNPESPLPGDQIDAQFNAIKATLDAIRVNLALIQRDDGALANEIVGADQLNSEITTLLTVAGLAAALADAEQYASDALSAKNAAETAETNAETAETNAEAAAITATTAAANSEGLVFSLIFGED